MDAEEKLIKLNLRKNVFHGTEHTVHRTALGAQRVFTKDEQPIGQLAGKPFAINHNRSAMIHRRQERPQKLILSLSSDDFAANRAMI